MDEKIWFLLATVVMESSTLLQEEDYDLLTLLPDSSAALTIGQPP